MPDELKARTDTKGESSLRGHLKADGDEQTGSQSYIPPDPKDDKALKMAARPAARRRAELGLPAESRSGPRCRNKRRQMRNSGAAEGRPARFCGRTGDPPKSELTTG